MKKLFTAVAVLFIFAACDKENVPAGQEFSTVGQVSGIRVSNVKLFNDNSSITELAFVARFHMPAGAGGTGLPQTNDDTRAAQDGGDSRVMLRAAFNSKETTLTLPQEPPVELLRSISSDFPDDFNISDPEAKTINFTEIACDISGQGTFSKFVYSYLDLHPIVYELTYIYSDRPVTISGEGADWWGHPTVYDLSLKKGWNMVVEKTDYSGGVQNRSFTHRMPNGMRWEESMWL